MRSHFSFAAANRMPGLPCPMANYREKRPVSSKSPVFVLDEIDSMSRTRWTMVCQSTPRVLKEDSEYHEIHVPLDYCPDEGANDDKICCIVVS